jgi:hypothetical protein
MTGDGTVQYICIYQLLTHGAHVAPSFFRSEKGDEKGQAEAIGPLHSIILNLGSCGAPQLNSS